MQMRPLSQLAAALARRGRGACGPGCAPPHAAHIAGSAGRPSSGAALLRRPGPPAGRGAARAVAAAPPRRAGCKLWWRPRGAVSAGAPGSPLYRVSAPPPAPRTPPPPPPPGRPSRSERPRAGLRPGAFVSPGPLGRRTSCASGRPTASGPREATRRAARLAQPAPAQVPLSPDFLSRLLFTSRGPPATRQARRLAARAECARWGGRTSARATFRFGSGAGRAAPPLPAFSSPLLSPAPPPPVPTDSRASAPPAATTRASRLRARLPGPPHSGRLKSRGGRGQRGLGMLPPLSLPPAPWPQRLLSRPTEWATNAIQSSKSTKVQRACRVSSGFRG